MADKGFNKSTLSFGGVPLGTMRSINYEETCPEADTTGAGDGMASMVAGIPAPSMSVTVVGKLDAAVVGGAKGALVAAWNDGGDAGSLGNVQVVRCGTSGQMNGEILSTVTFKPSSVP